MNKLQYFFKKIKDVKPSDYLSVFPMLLALLVKPFFKEKNKDTWIICEDPFEARDNGYWLFKYIVENHPEQKCIYFIKKKSVDYKKVKAIGNVQEYGSLKHWIYYFTCKYNISSQKGGKPNAALCSFMELNNIFKPHNIFLQHGVIKDALEWLYADRSCIEKFITSAVPEYLFVDNTYGYSKGTVQRTGLPRFDNLHNCNINKNQILIMPSWRAWFSEPSSRKSKADADFTSSDYLKEWKALLNSKELGELINRYNLKVIFYPHRNMQKYIHEFEKVRNNVVIARAEEYDVQTLLKESEMMITDYSSVFFDMVYMKKPVIFYQFDEEKFRDQQYKEGYFDYHNNPFGKSYNNYKQVLDELEEIVNGEYKISDAYKKAHKEYFPYFDDNNAKRIYDILVKE